MWFKVYAGVLGACYFAVSIYGIFLLDEPTERGNGIVYLLLGIPLLSACWLPIVLRPRPWLWKYDLVIICLGLTSACFLPVCAPLLNAWRKPETKKFFGRADPT